MKVIIVGAGAQGRVILDIVRAQGYKDAVFVDDNSELSNTEINGAKVLSGMLELLRSGQNCSAIVALGNPLKRISIAKTIAENGGGFLNAIHPSAVVSPTAALGHGNMIGATCVVNTNAKIGDHIIINTGAVVEHDCVLNDGCAISPGAHLGGRVSIGDRAFVSTGAIVLSRLRIGADAVVAAGAVVTRDVPDNVMVAGIPARIIERWEPGCFDWSRVL